jgi:Fe2+ transport system protein FeoA
LRTDRLESLADCSTGVSHVVARVSDQDKAFLNYLTEEGLNPGARLVVRSRSSGADAVTLSVGDSGKTVTMGTGAAEKILVRKLD